MTPDALWYLALVAAVGAGCFYAGWRSAAAYLPAARAVSEVSSAAVIQFNAFGAALDKNETTLTSLRSAVTQNTETLEARHRAVEEAIITLLQGMERAGFARTASTRPAPRQVGEPPPES